MSQTSQAQRTAPLLHSALRQKKKSVYSDKKKITTRNKQIKKNKRSIFRSFLDLKGAVNQLPWECSLQEANLAELPGNMLNMCHAWPLPRQQSHVFDTGKESESLSPPDMQALLVGRADRQRTPDEQRSLVMSQCFALVSSTVSVLSAIYLQESKDRRLNSNMLCSAIHWIFTNLV